jgi:hypothetical protein
MRDGELMRDGAERDGELMRGARDGALMRCDLGSPIDC